MNHLHLINRNRSFYIYIPSTYNIVKVNKFTFKVIQMLLQGISKDVICKTFGVTQREIAEMENYFMKLAHEISNPQHLMDNNHEEGKTIDRITLHVSNDCNLRCKYCYASGGHYKNDRGLMTRETANDFVDFCIREFKQVRNIVFFGGEPFINPSVIQYVCQMFVSSYEKGKIDYLPQFGAITNGIIMSPQVMDIIARYFSFLTVSIDGPKDANDTNRVDVSGTGSFDRISKFIKQVQKIPKLSVQYEATFTEEHTRLGYSHDDIRHFMKRTFNLTGEVLDEYNAEKNALKEDAAFFTAEDILNGKYPEGFLSILRALITKRAKTMCQLYRQSFSVSIEGRIFPCHMNTGEENCELGTITSNNAFSNPNDYLKKHPGIMYGFKNNEVCRNCWANNLCGGCSRLWFYKDTDANYSMFPNRELCERNCKHIENILAGIGDMRDDPSKWIKFKEMLKIS